MRAGRWADQLRCNRLNLQIALELGDVPAELAARVNLGVVLANLGELDEAVAHTEIAVGHWRRAGARISMGLALANLAMYLLEKGDLDRAERCVSDAIALIEDFGERRTLPEAHQTAARVAARRGDLVAARVAALRSVEVARSAGTDLDAAIGLRLAAEIDARRGDAPAAAAQIAEATALAAQADAFERARLDAAAARIHDRFGRPEDARAPRARARAVFERLGARLETAALHDLDEVR
jgi:tetratricopeptide (TPR) repeat protein